MATILIVDDRREIRETLRQVLARCGYAVEIASNGQEAINQYRTIQPDVVLLDMFMPVMNGFDALFLMRQEFPNAKVIAAMKDSTHGYSGKMGDQDFTDIANFVTKGQIDIDAIIDRKSKMAKGGDKAKGERYYNTVCAGCHDKSGKMPEDMPPLGMLSNKNPWEIIQKIQNGQPDEPMPAMRAFDLQVSVDILSYLQTLPKE